jgi:hypothetical protein
VSGQLDERRNVGGQIGRGVGIGDPFADCRVGIDHARWNCRIVLLERALEVRHAGVRLGLRHEDFGAAAPHHHQPIEVVGLLEQANVFHHLLGEISLVAPFLHVRPVETLHVTPIEHRRPRPDLLEIAAHLVEQRRLDHASGLGRRIAVVFEDVPAAEHEILEAGERNHLADFRRTSLGALAEANGSHLR